MGSYSIGAEWVYQQMSHGEARRGDPALAVGRQLQEDGTSRLMLSSFPLGNFPLGHQLQDPSCQTNLTQKQMKGNDRGANGLQFQPRQELSRDPRDSFAPTMRSSDRLPKAFDEMMN